jgi:hypothetical protein
VLRLSGSSVLQRGVPACSGRHPLVAFTTALQVSGRSAPHLQQATCSSSRVHHHAFFFGGAFSVKCNKRPATCSSHAAGWETHPYMSVDKAPERCVPAFDLRAYAAIGSMGLGSEEHSQLRFLLQAVGLRAMQASDPGACGRMRLAAACGAMAMTVP